MDYWRVVARKFAKNPNVIGYDIINEPFAANLQKDFSLFYDQGKFDREVLQKFYTKASAVIREVDQDHFIFFEPAQFPDVIPLNGGIIAEVGFTEMPQKAVLDEHLYCCLMEPGICDTGEAPLSKLAECKVFHERKMSLRKQDANRLKAPIMISEWGACSGSEACYVEMGNVADVMDEYTASWAYWQMKGFGDFTTTGKHVQGIYTVDGQIQPLKERALTRTYFQQYSGVPYYAMFDQETGDFMTEFRSMGGVSTIYMNHKLFYPNFYDISIIHKKSSKTLKYTWDDPKPNILKVECMVHGDLIVTITPRRLPEQNQGTLIVGNYFVEFSLEENANFDELPYVQISAKSEVGVRLVSKKGQEIKFAESAELKAAELVGSKFHLYSDSMFGLYRSELGSFKVPGLHGHHLQLTIMHKDRKTKGEEL